MSAFHTIKWLDSGLVSMIDQRKLPHDVIYNEYKSPAAVAEAIKDMVIRGAPAIGVTAAYGMAMEARRGGDLAAAREVLLASRPTATGGCWLSPAATEARIAYKGLDRP